MSHISVAAERIAQMQGFGPDYYCLPGGRAPREDEEEWSDLRWALEKVTHTTESERILQSLVIAENAAEEYLATHNPPARPAPDWEDWDEDDSPPPEKV